MPEIMEIGLTLPEGQRLHQSMGSILHGALMEYARPDFAAAMHKAGVRPFSQFVYFDKSAVRAVWRIAALNDAAADEIGYALAKMPQNLSLKQKEYVVQLGKTQLIKQQSCGDMVQQFFTTQQLPRKAEITFATSASFKAYGAYKIYPDNAYIFRSLLARWNAFSGGIMLEEEKLEQHLAEAVKVIGYNLSLQQYSVGGAPIDAFKGHYSLLLRGTQAQNRIAAMLLSYAEYAGIGIKTALGMGGVFVKLLP